MQLKEGAIVSVSVPQCFILQIHNISERNIVICLIVISNTVTHSHEILLSGLINSASISNSYGKRILYGAAHTDMISAFTLSKSLLFK